MELILQQTHMLPTFYEVQTWSDLRSGTNQLRLQKNISCQKIVHTSHCGICNIIINSCDKLKDFELLGLYMEIYINKTSSNVILTHVEIRLTRPRNTKRGACFYICMPFSKQINPHCNLNFYVLLQCSVNVIRNVDGPFRNYRATKP